MDSPTNQKVKFTQKDIKKLFAQAKRVLRQPGLDILLGHTELPQGRLLVVTPRLVGTAPERNKVRRRLKAVFYEERLFEQHYDCIVIVKKGGPAISFDKLRSYILQAYEHAPQKAAND